MVLIVVVIMIVTDIGGCIDIGERWLHDDKKSLPDSISIACSL